jgi:hypothetical protein
MIEILCIIWLCRAIGRSVRAKGRSAGGYQFLAVVLWLVGEVTGAIIGVNLGLGAGAYLTTLMGAAAGALVAYMIASGVTPVPASGSAIDGVFD